MKVKVLVMLSGLFMLMTLIVCVGVYSHYNSYANGSYRAGDDDDDPGTISVYSGANSSGLVTGHVSASASVGNKDDSEAANFWPGMKASVTASMSGLANNSGDASGYVSGVDVFGWTHRRTVDIEWVERDTEFTSKTTHTITPP